MHLGVVTTPASKSAIQKMLQFWPFATGANTYVRNLLTYATLAALIATPTNQKPSTILPQHPSL